MIDKHKDKIQVFAAMVMTVLVITAASFVVLYEPGERKDDVEEVLLSSDIVSTDPKESAVSFITYNGSIGELDLIDAKYIAENGFGVNRDRRFKALEAVEDAIVPGSPLINGNERKNIANTGDEGYFPEFFDIRNIKIGNPSKISKITVLDKDSNTEYDSVDIYADFDSYKTTFTWPLDASGDGSITRIESFDKFTDVKITLVKSGELWFIYDVDNAERLLNVRFATWSGLGKVDVNPETEKVEVISAKEINSYKGNEESSDE